MHHNSSSSLKYSYNHQTSLSSFYYIFRLLFPIRPPPNNIHTVTYFQHAYIRSCWLSSLRWGVLVMARAWTSCPSPCLIDAHKLSVQYCHGKNPYYYACIWLLLKEFERVYLWTSTNSGWYCSTKTLPLILAGRFLTSSSWSASSVHLHGDYRLITSANLLQHQSTVHVIIFTTQLCYVGIGHVFLNRLGAHTQVLMSRYLVHQQHCLYLA